MSLSPLVDEDQEMPEPQGHAIGFVDSQTDCDAVILELNAAGFSDSTITVLNGDNGIRLLTRMMSGSLWGEAAEDLMKQGVIELTHGHFALTIEARDREEALAVANASSKHGGHGFSYFGKMTDERLTR
jgi:hypothetical protein